MQMQNDNTYRHHLTSATVVALTSKALFLPSWAGFAALLLLVPGAQNADLVVFVFVEVEAVALAVLELEEVVVE